MKKGILLILTCVTTLTYAQKSKFSYKVGIITGLPANVSKTCISVGSTFLEASKKVSKKISATANSGYLRITSEGNTLSQIPVFIGAKYHINDQWYFGAGAGITIPTKTEYGDTEFGYSPYLGYQKGHISVDMRYYLSGLETPLSTIGLVFSYTL